MNKHLTYFVKVVLASMPAVFFTNFLAAQAGNIKNDVFWNTQDGKPIYSQGGGIFKFADPTTGAKKYYWYGVHYKEAGAYRENPSITQHSVTFESVTCYSSIDLVHWKFEGDVLTKEEIRKHSQRSTWLGRLGVAYIKKLKLENVIKVEGLLEGDEKFMKLARYRLFISASHYDSGNLSLDEAMACGTPGIVYDIPLLYYPRGVIKIPCFDKLVFAHSIVSLLSDRLALDNLSHEAMDFGETLDWEKSSESALSSLSM